MPAVQRQGDANGGGGIITSGEGSVLINGRPAATPGLVVTHIRLAVPRHLCIVLQ